MEAREEAMEQEREAQRLRIVEEERQKLLKRHATQLLGFLPQVRGRSHTLSCAGWYLMTNQQWTVSVSLSRACCVKRTCSTWMKTSGKTLYHVRRRMLLKTIRETMTWSLTSGSRLLHLIRKLHYRLFLFHGVSLSGVTKGWLTCPGQALVFPLSTCNSHQTGTHDKR